MEDSGLDVFWDFSSLPALVISSSFLIRRVSNGLLDAWNCGREEFLGRDLFDALYGGSPLQQFDRIPLTRAIEVAVTSRKYQFCYAAFKERTRSWSARIIPIYRRDELLSLVLEWEVIENEQAIGMGDELQAMLPVDDMFRLLIKSVKDYAIFLLDIRGYVTTWNAGAELLKGYKSDDIVGKHFSTFYGEEDLRAGKPEEELRTCLKHGRVQDEGWRFRKDGSKFWANVVITAIYRNDAHVGFGKVTRDLTERREGELRLISAYEESSKLKSEFLANISHEIRTPMHGMLSACAILLDTELSEDQRETANLIAESGQVLLQVINGILDYSKLTSGNFSVRLDTINVGSIISSVVRNTQTTLTPEVHIRLVLAPDLPAQVQGDGLRFRQIAQNIADNAAKFTKRGCISVHTSVQAQDDTTYTILTEIVDTGIGIKVADAQSLFMPFVQLEKSTKRNFQGTGLGLSIAKSLVELMGGEMGYRPNPVCEGSNFWFSVQLNKATGAEQPLATERQHDTNGGRYHDIPETEAISGALERLRQIAPTKRLLAVEDNIINQKVLLGMLHTFGIKRVAIAQNGVEAVSKLTSSPDMYDLVLMDISMPVMDGFEATTNIRNSGMQIPIIAMTANALQGDMERCLGKGMNDYMPKPMNRNLLLQKLLWWLDPASRPFYFSDKALNSQQELPILLSEACKAG